MVSLVFDSSALLRYLDLESGWERVDELLSAASAESARIISAVQWGEIAGSVRRKNRSIDVHLTQQDAILITAGFDFKALEHLIAIEFLSPKPITP